MNVIRVVLLTLYAWSLSNTISILLRTGSIDRLVLEAVGLGALFWLFLITLAITEVVVIIHLIRPIARAFAIAVVGFVVGILETLVVTSITISNPALLKEAFIISRSQRGLPIREEVLSAMDNPITHLFGLGFSLLFGLLCLYLLYRVDQQRIRKG